MSQKIVLKVHLNCKKCRRRAMKTIAGTKGVDSIVAEENDSKITVIGDADPVCLTNRLRKFGFAEVESVGPSKEPEPEKTPEPEKPEKEAPEPDEIIKYVVLPTSSYYPCDSYTYYCTQENPNACSIQ